jgi:uncharacterized protein (TIGR03000 family)
MVPRLSVIGGVLVLVGSLILTTTEPARAVPPGGLHQGGGSIPTFPSAGLQPAPHSIPSNIYAPPSYEPYRLFPYYSYNYNYGLYPTYNRSSTTYTRSSGYGEFPSSSEYTEPYPQPGPAAAEDRLPGGVAPGRGPAEIGAAARAPADTGAARGERIARLRVRVPAGAEVWFDGFKTSSTGPAREFETPPLRPGKYAYTVRARWKEDGQEVTQSRDVVVTPGADIQVQFPRPDGAGSAPQR